MMSIIRKYWVEFIWRSSKPIGIYITDLQDRLEAYIKENQAFSGRIKLLEEQHDIMHNFLVEINKYLVNLSEKNNGIRVDETKAKGKKATKRDRQDH